jgi:hypothetical protein
MTDRLTKALLAAIALGLWMNVASEWLRPVVVRADAASDLSEIAHDVHALYSGVCINRKVC